MVIRMKIAICDDEKLVREVLKEKIQEYCIQKTMDVNLITFEDGEGLLEYKLSQIDVLFLDVDIPGKDGLQIAKEIRQDYKEMIIVFLTAYSEFVFESFKVDAFRYLTKPLKTQELHETLDAIGEKLCEPENFLNFSFQNETYSIKYDDIIYIEGMRDKIWIYCPSHTYRWRERMKNINEMLESKGFFQVHQSYIINMNKIRKYSAKTVQLEDGYEVPISKYRYEEFKEAYLKFWSKAL